MCDYFILTKEITSDIGFDKTNQVIALTNKKCILPKNNIIII